MCFCSSLYFVGCQCGLFLGLGEVPKFFSSTLYQRIIRNISFCLYFQLWYFLLFFLLDEWSIENISRKLRSMLNDPSKDVFLQLSNEWNQSRATVKVQISLMKELSQSFILKNLTSLGSSENSVHNWLIRFTHQTFRAFSPENKLSDGFFICRKREDWISLNEYCKRETWTIRIWPACGHKKEIMFALGNLLWNHLWNGCQKSIGKPQNVSRRCADVDNWLFRSLSTFVSILSDYSLHDERAVVLREFFFSEVRSFIHNTKEEAVRLGYVKTALGYSFLILNIARNWLLLS